MPSLSGALLHLLCFVLSPVKRRPLKGAASFNSNVHGFLICHVPSLPRPSMPWLGALGVMGRMYCATEPRNEAAVSSNSGRSFQA